jgi:hypothetical protein
LPFDARADIGFIWNGEFQRMHTVTANNPSAAYSMTPTAPFAIRKHASSTPVGVVMIGEAAAQPPAPER